MYIFNRKGKCLFYKEWNRPFNTLADDPEEEKKLVFGMLFSLKDLVSKLTPSGTANSEAIHSMRTDNFTLHHFQSVTGLMFVINTDSQSYDLHLQLEWIYRNLFVEFVSRNPLYTLKPDETVNCPLFAQKLEEYITSLPAWKS